MGSRGNDGEPGEPWEPEGKLWDRWAVSAYGQHTLETYPRWFFCHRFRLKFKSLIEQYELREHHFQSLMKTKECEVQVNVTRYEHQRKLAENESTRSRTLSAQVSTFSQTETELRSQLNIYVEKFKQASQLELLNFIFLSPLLEIFKFNFKYLCFRYRYSCLTNISI